MIIINNPKVAQNFFEKDAHWSFMSIKMEKKKSSHEYKYLGQILYLTAPKPSENRFPNQHQQKVENNRYFYNVI